MQARHLRCDLRSRHLTPKREKPAASPEASGRHSNQPLILVDQVRRAEVALDHCRDRRATFRKTERRRQPRAAFGIDEYPVALTLILPPEIAAFVSPGRFGFNIQVLPGGVLQTHGRSIDHAVDRSREFFKVTATGRHFVRCAEFRTGDNSRTKRRWLAVIDGVVSASRDEPKISA